MAEPYEKRALRDCWCTRPGLILKSTSIGTAVIPSPSVSWDPDNVPPVRIGCFTLVFERLWWQIMASTGQGGPGTPAMVNLHVSCSMSPSANDEVLELDVVLQGDYAINSVFNIHTWTYSTAWGLVKPLEPQKFVLKSVRKVVDVRKGDLVKCEVRTYAKPRKYQNHDEFSAHAMELVKELYDSRDSTGDANMISGTGTEFKVHKLVLAPQSPVLKAAFEIDMKEKQKNAVKLADFSDKVVTSLICFLYNGWTNAIQEETYEMLQIAHLYQMEKLSNLCWDHVLKTLSTGTVFRSLILADRFGAEGYKIQFSKYFKRFHTYLKKSPEFDEFVRENTPLYLQVCKM